MPSQDKTRQKKGIQIGHVAIAFLILTGAVAIIVLYLNKSNNYYGVLSNEVLDIINEADQLPPIDIVSTDGKVPPVTIDEPAPVKVIFYSETKHRESIEYYSNTKLRAISYLDESEKLVRQDLLDLEGRIRIRLYYNSNGGLVQREYYDENNRRVSQKIYLPVGGGRTGY